MNYLTDQLLNAEEINLKKKELEQATQDWEDGKKTAGSHASKVKNNFFTIYMYFFAKRQYTC